MQRTRLAKSRLPLWLALAALLPATQAGACGTVMLGSETSGGGGSSSGGGGTMASSTAWAASSSVSGAGETSSASGASSAGGASSSGGSCASACSQASDCPSVSCLTATCEAGCCGAMPVPAGSPCGVDGGSLVCDGNGACAPTCATTADCPAPGPCLTVTCVNDICDTSTLVGMACSAPVAQCCSGVCSDVTVDSLNCGTCGQECGHGACKSSTCVEPVQLATAGEPAGLAIDATNVYWTDENSIGTGVGRVMMVPLAGGVPVEIATGQDNPSAIAVDATSVYWTTRKAIMKAPIGGGPAVALASAVTPAAIALLDDTVYWLNLGSPPDYVDGSVQKVSTVGGAVTQLASGGGPGIAVNTQGVYWTTGETVMRVPLAGGTATELASGAKTGSIALDATNVYWVNSGSGLIMSLPLAGGTATPLVSGPDPNETLASIAVSSGTLYWVTAAALKKTPIGGGPTTVLANDGVGGVAWTQGVAVGASSVYWIGHSSTSEAIFAIGK